MIDEEKLNTVSTVARRIQKSESAVRYAAATGRLPFIRTATGQRLFRESDVAEFLKKQKTQSEMK